MSLESDVEVLRRIAFFDGFSDEHLKLIAFSAESRSLPDKLLLYDDGQLLHSAYVVVAGTLRGERRDKGQTIAARAIGPGMILGERALILDTRATESVRVDSPARVLQIRKVTFRRLLQEYPAIAVALRARLSRSVLASAAELAAAMQRLSALDG